MNNFLFLGGDLRSTHAASRLNKSFDCALYGFENLPSPPETRLLTHLTPHKNVILGLPAVADGEYINAPYSANKIPLEALLSAIEPGGTVYCGKTSEKLSLICMKNSLRLIDYFAREELTVMNAVPTAEGALEIILREKPVTIFGMNILITGFGRITKVMVRQLTALGANVTVCARKYADLSWAKINGCKTVHLSQLDRYLGEYDTIVNTVPAILFDRERLARLMPGCLIVDLASKAGVEDCSSGVNVVWALSLPGKTAPVTAGHIIADTIMNIITEGGE